MSAASMDGVENKTNNGSGSMLRFVTRGSAAAAAAMPQGNASPATAAAAASNSAPTPSLASVTRTAHEVRRDDRIAQIKAAVLALADTSTAELESLINGIGQSQALRMQAAIAYKYPIKSQRHYYADDDDGMYMDDDDYGYGDMDGDNDPCDGDVCSDGGLLPMLPVTSSKTNNNNNKNNEEKGTNALTKESKRSEVDAELENDRDDAAAVSAAAVDSVNMERRANDGDGFQPVINRKSKKKQQQQQQQQKDAQSKQRSNKNNNKNKRKEHGNSKNANTDNKDANGDKFTSVSKKVKAMRTLARVHCEPQQSAAVHDAAAMRVSIQFKKFESTAEQEVQENTWMPILRAINRGHETAAKAATAWQSFVSALLRSVRTVHAVLPPLLKMQPLACSSVRLVTRDPRPLREDEKARGIVRLPREWQGAAPHPCALAARDEALHIDVQFATVAQRATAAIGLQTCLDALPARHPLRATTVQVSIGGDGAVSRQRYRFRYGMQDELQECRTHEEMHQCIVSFLAKAGFADGQFAVENAEYGYLSRRGKYAPVVQADMCTLPLLLHESFAGRGAAVMQGAIQRCLRCAAMPVRQRGLCGTSNCMRHDPEEACCLRCGNWMKRTALTAHRMQDKCKRCPCLVCTRWHRGPCPLLKPHYIGVAHSPAMAPFIAERQQQQAQAMEAAAAHLGQAAQAMQAAQPQQVQDADSFEAQVQRAEQVMQAKGGRRPYASVAAGKQPQREEEKRLVQQKPLPQAVRPLPIQSAGQVQAPTQSALYDAMIKMMQTVTARLDGMQDAITALKQQRNGKRKSSPPQTPVVVDADKRAANSKVQLASDQSSDAMDAEAASSVPPAVQQ